MRLHLGICGAAALMIAAGGAAPAPAQAPRWVPPPPAPGHEYPPCYCTNRGRKAPLGATACLTVGGKSFLARCEMSLNNPIWRKVSDLCPTSALAGPFSAAARAAPPANPPPAPR
ncbi:hypothetical protein [Oceanicella actignis]|uniref:hypothetical protein n=1 Tax=Oceanicella actignis TaxID=1189325 RepID=UPI0011E69E9E|nr:hypothetical protein [Oceanicella actignis]TYO90157.1 hypothetical protein LY05_01358 [Oceanicella actignis]